MGHLAQRIKGIPSSTLVGTGLVVFLGVIMVANVRPSTGAKSAGDAGTVDAEAFTVTTPTNVPLATLAKSDDYKGKAICTCGFVRSFGSSPDHGIDRKRRKVLHNVFVTEMPDAAPDDPAVATAICTWTEGAKPDVKERQEVCVQGEYVGPVVRRCSVVPKCN